MTETASASSGGRLRLFYAALPDGGARAHLMAAARSLTLEPGVKWTSPENYHMTLAFVGNLAASLLPLLRGVGERLSARTFSLTFGEIEYWPASGVVVAAALYTPGELQRLSKRLHQDLAEHVHIPETLRLRPHVTLARKVAQAPVPQAMSRFEWCVREFSLLRSDTSGVQSAYTVVDTWPLLDSLENTR